MIIAITAIFLVGFITVAVIGMREAKTGLDSLEAERAYAVSSEEQSHERSHPARWHSSVYSADGLEASRFTSSLLALSKAQTQWTHSSPERVPAESSSLVSVPQPELKSLSRES